MIDKLSQELKIKDRLISKLLEDEDRTSDTNDVSLRVKSKDSVPQKPSRNLADANQKLRSELDAAYKILTQQEAEMNKMRKHVKQQTYNQCNEERVLYMNECLRL